MDTFLQKLERLFPEGKVETSTLVKCLTEVDPVTWNQEKVELLSKIFPATVDIAVFSEWLYSSDATCPYDVTKEDVIDFHRNISHAPTNPMQFSDIMPVPIGRAAKAQEQSESSEALILQTQAPEPSASAPHRASKYTKKKSRNKIAPAPADAPAETTNKAPATTSTASAAAPPQLEPSVTQHQNATSTSACAETGVSQPAMTALSQQNATGLLKPASTPQEGPAPEAQGDTTQEHHEKKKHDQAEETGKEKEKYTFGKSLTIHPREGLVNGGQTVAMYFRTESNCEQVHVKFGEQPCKILYHGQKTLPFKNTGFDVRHQMFLTTPPGPAGPCKVHLMADGKLLGPEEDLEKFEYVRQLRKIYQYLKQRMRPFHMVWLLLIFVVLFLATSEILQFTPPWNVARCATAALLFLGVPFSLSLSTAWFDASLAKLRQQTVPRVHCNRLCHRDGHTYLSFDLSDAYLQSDSLVVKASIAGHPVKIQKRAPNMDWQKYIQWAMDAEQQKVRSAKERLHSLKEAKCKFKSSSDIESARDFAIAVLSEKVESLETALQESKKDASIDRSSAPYEIELLAKVIPRGVIFGRTDEFIKIDLELASGQTLFVWSEFTEARFLIDGNNLGPTYGPALIAFLILAVASGLLLTAYIVFKLHSYGSFSTDEQGLLFVLSLLSAGIGACLVQWLFYRLYVAGTLASHPLSSYEEKQDMSSFVSLDEFSSFRGVIVDGQEVPRSSLWTMYHEMIRLQEMQFNFSLDGKSRNIVIQTCHDHETELSARRFNAPSSFQKLRAMSTKGTLAALSAKVGLNTLSQGHRVRCITALPPYVLTGGDDCTVKVWTSTGILVCNCICGTTYLCSVAAAGDNFIAAEEDSITLWQVKSNGTGSLTEPDVSCLDEIPQPNCQGIARASWFGREDHVQRLGQAVSMNKSKDGRIYVVTASMEFFGGGPCYLYEVRQARLHRLAILDIDEFGEYFRIRDMGINNVFISVAKDTAVYLFDLQGDRQHILEHAVRVTCTALMDSFVFTCCWNDDRIYIWHAKSGELLHLYPYPPVEDSTKRDLDRGINTLSAKDGLLAAGSNHNTAQVFKVLSSGQLSPGYAIEHTHDVTAVALAILPNKVTAHHGGDSAMVLLSASPGEGVCCWEAPKIPHWIEEASLDEKLQTQVSVEKRGPNSDSPTRQDSHYLLETHNHANPIEATLISQPMAMFKSAHGVQMIAPFATVVATFLQLQAFPLSPEFPWNPKAEPIQLVFNIAILNLDLVQVQVDVYAMFKTKLKFVLLLITPCICFIYANTPTWIRRQLQKIKAPMIVRMTWYSLLRFNGDEAESEVQDRIKTIKLQMVGAGIASKEILDGFEEEYQKINPRHRKKLARAVERSDYSVVAPALFPKFIFLEKLQSLFRVLTLIMSTILVVPVVRTLTMTIDCSKRNGLYTFDAATKAHPPEVVECWKWPHAIVGALGGVALLLWIPPLFGIIAANGQVEALTQDSRWGFALPSHWRKASQRTTDVMPMGLVTRTRHKYHFDMGMTASRLLMCVFDVMLSENKVRLASAYVLVATAQLLITLRFRPYSHSAMYCLTIGLYLACWFGCILGLLVVWLNDTTLEYPVHLLYGGYLVAFLVTLVLCACVDHEDHGIFDTKGPSSKYSVSLSGTRAEPKRHLPRLRESSG